MRLILIDNGSGYIFGDTADLPRLDASTLDGLSWRAAAVCAAHALDVSIGAPGRTYSAEERNPRDTSTGYHVYRADVRGSDAVPVFADGQDAEAIAAVERDCEYLAYVRIDAGSE
jgi:hypothetical protein